MKLERNLRLRSKIRNLISNPCLQSECTARQPPGNEIYRKGTLSVFEVDGGEEFFLVKIQKSLISFFICRIFFFITIRFFSNKKNRKYGFSFDSALRILTNLDKNNNLLFLVAWREVEWQCQFCPHFVLLRDVTQDVNYKHNREPFHCKGLRTLRNLVPATWDWNQKLAK